ncbi:MAG: PLDc N-terminal domain-containing protein [Actinomycetes bacterium]
MTGAEGSFPILNIFLEILFFALFFIWIMILFHVIVDLFRSKDMGGAAKALWLFFLIVLPYLGVFVYLIARGASMHERDVKAAEESEQAFRQYVAQASPAEELAKLHDLKEKGAITDAEYNAAKGKIIG